MPYRAPPTFVFQQILPGFSSGHEANFDGVSFGRVGVLLARVSGAAAHGSTAAEPRLFDDGEHVTVDAETFHRRTRLSGSLELRQRPPYSV